MPEFTHRHSQRQSNYLVNSLGRERANSRDASNEHPPITQRRLSGNQAMQRLLSARQIQAKLSIGHPQDQYEQEADRVADAVVRMPDPEVTPAAAISSQGNKLHIRRMCSECDDELQRQAVDDDEEKLQAKEVAGTTPEVTPQVQSQVASMQGRGLPLPGTTRTFFEPRFGSDLSRVRIHTDVQAAESARQIKARAYTLGRDIVFAAGEYCPETLSGRRLLAHELTHTIQQTGTTAQRSEQPAFIQRKINDGHDLRSLRFRRDPVLESCFDNERLLMVGANGLSVEKIQLALIDLGFTLPKFGADGDFGSETKAAVQQYQRAHGLVDDGIIGPKTMDSLDAQFIAPLQQTSPPSAPPVPRPPGKLDADIMNEARDKGIKLTDDAVLRIARLRGLVSRGNLAKGTPEDLNTLRALQFWLHINLANRFVFLQAVDRAMGVMGLNSIIPHTMVHRTGIDGFHCKTATIASALIEDVNRSITCCDIFFNKGPQCQRNVLIHERFHLVGVSHGENAKGQNTTQATRTTAQALNSANDLTDLINDVMSKQMFVCNTNL